MPTTATRLPNHSTISEWLRGGAFVCGERAAAPETELREQLRALHDSMIERSFVLDRRGHADASDELNRFAEELRQLLDGVES
ncbi:hypothetical protein DB347_03870 [Opitutaceae bacterium EW11]|nr:hypothetical protein DB347_03870 [Opitutaceae bacterium EW11]